MNILIGFITGVAASMGLGGGFILLVYLSSFTDAPQDIAQGVNLLFFLPIALLSLCIHAKNKLIEWKLVGQYLIFGLAGVGIGCALAFIIDTDLLRTLFAVLILIAGAKELFHKKKKNDEKTDVQKNISP